MTIAKGISKRINELFNVKNLSLYKLSKNSCIPLSTLKNLSNGHTKSPTLSLIYKLADGFDMSFIEFLNTPFLSKENVDYLD